MRHRALLSLGLLLALGGLLFAAWRSIEARPDAPATHCTCALERARSGWCEACGVGYVAGVALPSKILYDALDAHGHDLDLAALACPDCQAAARTDDFCARHQRGFVGGRAYLSRLAYHSARGEPDAVRDELRLLDLALATSARCELCAAAMVIDGDCPVCRLSYREGRATPAR